MKNNQNEVGAFNVRGGARYIDVSPSTFLKLLRQNEFPHKRVGRRVLVAKSALDAWLVEENK